MKRCDTKNCKKQARTMTKGKRLCIKCYNAEPVEDEEEDVNKDYLNSDPN